MRKFVMGVAAAALAMTGQAAFAKDTKGSSARQQQTRQTAEIPRCGRNLGAIAIVEPEYQWWRDYNLQSPEAILRIFVQRSGCFSLVNRGRSMNKRYEERGLADSGELQRGSNLGRGQVRVADYYLEPNIVTTNKNSGGGGLGGIVGGFGGALLGGLKVKKSEANVTLSVVDVRTTEEVALSEGYARKSDLAFGGGGGGWFGGTFAGVAGGGYQNTEIGQVLVLAYLDAYTKLVSEMGGLPQSASAAAPQAR
ncbi:MAG: penicillin-binding protein activator LpoB [Novosphingobium sp.]|nr:penicillin-binding protein activator LpoB [Novosphingobium sp.]